MIPNKNNFDLVCRDLDMGLALNLHHIGMIFGSDFWELLILVQSNINIKSDGKIEIHIHEKLE